jgi:tetratricopeptide (TPR) repeat protein
MHCLNGQLIGLGALTAELSGDAPLDIDRALQVIASTEPASLCSREGRGSAGQKIAKRRSRELDKALAPVEARVRLGKFDEAMASLVELETRGNVAGSGHLSYLKAQILEDQGHLDESKAVYELALPQALRQGDEILVAKLWLGILYLVGYEQMRYEVALELSQAARMAVARAGSAILEHRLSAYLGAIEAARGSYDQAESHLRASVEGYTELLGADHPLTLQSRHNLADVLRTSGRLEESARLFQEVLIAREKVLGSDHQRVLSSKEQLAKIDYARGRYREALRVFQEVLEARSRAMGTQSAKVAESHITIGATHSAMGDSAAAIAEYGRALDILGAIEGPDHPMIALTRNNLANALLADKRYQEAVDELREVLRINTAKLGPEHPRVAMNLCNLGEAEAELQGDCRVGLPRWRTCLELREKILDAKHPDLAYPLESIGRCELERGRPARAQLFLQRALTLRTQSKVDPLLTAGTRFALAQAQWKSGGRNRARELARAALAAFGDHNQGASEAQEIARWLDTRAP